MNDCKKHGIFHLVGCDPLCQVMTKFVQNHEGNSDWNERLRHHIRKLRVGITSSIIMLHLAKKACVRTIGTIIQDWQIFRYSVSIYVIYIIYIYIYIYIFIYTYTYIYIYNIYIYVDILA